MHTTIRQHRPDFFVHCGDLIYADAPIRRRRRTKDGRVWTNVTYPGQGKGRREPRRVPRDFRYNLLDQPFRRLNAEVPIMVQWDDHETKNNWWPGRILDEDRRYTVKSCNLLAARGRQAFFEYTPIAAQRYAPGRIYRHIPARSDARPVHARRAHVPGAEYAQPPDRAKPGDRVLWTAAARLAGGQPQQVKAAWKVVASDQPLSLLIGSGRRRFEGIGNVRGKPLGRELEIAWLLATLKERGVKNVVWITADVHYAAAYHYRPQRGSFRDFDPFWEFVAGPINAGTFGPNSLDPTFGPSPVYVSEPPKSVPGRSPLAGAQYFGMMAIDPRSKGLHVQLRNLDDELMYEKRLAHRV